MSDDSDLVSMADVARMAGQSRSTVGNWKARYADFPPPAHRTGRGPLYARTEIEDWLRRTYRLPSSPTKTAGSTEVLAYQNDPAIDHVDVAIVFMALRKFCDPAQWQRVLGLAEQLDFNGIDKVVETVIPFAGGVIDWRGQATSDADLTKVIKDVSQQSPDDIPNAIDSLLYRSTVSASDQRRTTQPAFRGLIAVPPAVRALMAGLLYADDDDPDAASIGGTPSSRHSIYQAGPGLAQLLVEIASNAVSFSGQLFAQEPTSQGAAIARLNTAIHDIPAQVEHGDIFEEDCFPQLRADRVVCVPPWEPKIPHLTDTGDDPRWVFGEPGSNDGYFAWVQHCLYHLADGGRAVLLLPSNVLVDRGRPAHMRRRLVKAGLLQGVVSLPAGALPGRSARGTLLVLGKTPAGEYGTVMIDLSIPPDRSEERVTLTAASVKETLRTYYMASMQPETLNTVLVDLNDIAANDFVLDPARYQDETPTTSYEQSSHRLMSLRYRLDALLADCQQADEQVKKMLELNP